MQVSHLSKFIRSAGDNDNTHTIHGNILWTWSQFHEMCAAPRSISLLFPDPSSCSSLTETHSAHSHSISLWHSMCRFTPNKSTCTRIFISAHSASLPFLHPLPSISRCICCCCCSLFSLVHIESLRVFNLQSHYQMRNMEMRIITSNTDSLNHWKSS